MKFLLSALTFVFVFSGYSSFAMMGPSTLSQCVMLINRLGTIYPPLSFNDATGQIISGGGAQFSSHLKPIVLNTNEGTVVQIDGKAFCGILDSKNPVSKEEYEKKLKNDAKILVQSIQRSLTNYMSYEYEENKLGMLLKTDKARTIEEKNKIKEQIKVCDKFINQFAADNSPVKLGTPSSNIAE